MPPELIGQILTRQSGLDPANLSAALEAQGRDAGHERLGQVLLNSGVVSESDILRALATQWNLPLIDAIPPEKLDRDRVLRFSFEFLRRHALLPLRDDDGGVTVATADPLDVNAFDAVAGVLQRPCSRVLCTPGRIQEALTRCHYQEGDTSSDILDELNDADGLARVGQQNQTEDLMDVANRAPIVRLVNTIFYQAVRSRASDIHVEPYEKNVKVRFRIDGVLHGRFTPPRQYVEALTSRLKIMANLNIAERRLPQDGRSRIRIGDREIDIRVSTIPTSGGERVVLRLLDRAGAHFGVGGLGFEERVERQFRRLIHLPHGIILLTGPTGSGKTTTLYAALTEINTEDRNILTVEDPIEYQLPGVGQMQVQPKIGLAFASSLRNILRQDPDVIMVGEIRDVETAEIAVQAALTGHLVFSTLHTNDSASAVTRLLDMEIEPYLVSSSILAVMAQRLVRVICADCATTCAPGQEARAILGEAAARLPAEISRGEGCEACLGTGFKGRAGIFELLLIDDQVREMIMARSAANIVKQTAIAKGMRTLRDDGIRKVSLGETTIEEVLRVTQEDVLTYD